jgi:four helix bundle protein
MPPIRRFEDLIAWQRARTLCARVRLAVESGGLSKDYKLADQIRASASSVMANVAEGFERRSPRDFRKFLLIAKASCAEVKSHLYCALDAGYLTPADGESLIREADEVGRIIGGLIRAVTRHVNSS